LDGVFGQGANPPARWATNPTDFCGGMAGLDQPVSKEFIDIIRTARFNQVVVEKTNNKFRRDKNEL